MSGVLTLCLAAAVAGFTMTISLGGRPDSFFGLIGSELIVGLIGAPLTRSLVVRRRWAIPGAIAGAAATSVAFGYIFLAEGGRSAPFAMKDAMACFWLSPLFVGPGLLVFHSVRWAMRRYL